MIENDQLRQCLIEINRQLQRLLLIHRLPTENLPEVLNQDNEPFETRSFFLLFTSCFNLIVFLLELINLPCEAVYEIVQRHFSKLYEHIDRYMLQNH